MAEADRLRSLGGRLGVYEGITGYWSRSAHFTVARCGVRRYDCIAGAIDLFSVIAMDGTGTITVFDLRSIGVGEIEVTFGVTRGAASMRATITYPVDTRLGALRWESVKLQNAGYLALTELMKANSIGAEDLNAALERYLLHHRLRHGISRREGGRLRRLKIRRRSSPDSQR